MSVEGQSRAIEALLEESRVFPPDEAFRRQANVADEAIYERASRDPEGFWAERAGELRWMRKWDRVLEWNAPFAKWFLGGQLNVSDNCLDRFLGTPTQNKAALIWEGEPGDERVLTYRDLHREVCKFANVLKSLGVGKGDRVAIYLPMIPEAAIAMLACTRIGAPHNVVFGGFSAEALRDRMNDSQAKLLITADGGYRRGGVVRLKQAADEAMEGAPSVQKVVVVRRVGDEANAAFHLGRDVWWHEAMAEASLKSDPEPMDSEDLLYILYTSGSTGKPKGIAHTTGGYLTGVMTTTKWVFDLKESDVYWCTADVGWVTGHSYVVYGPLACGATVLMYEGAPDYPDKDRFWALVEKYGVTVLYTAPTAIRAFMRWGEQYPKRHDMASLRLLGSVGEPINPEAWLWYYNVVGDGRCPIVDTWWQTETGGILISPLPGAIPTKPGSATKPFFGVKPVMVDNDGKLIEEIACEGNLCIGDSWPGQMRTVFGDHVRFVQTYFSTFEGKYFTGDGARRDEDGYYWITGRVDDVINVSGHRMGTAEIESALVAHPKVAEAAVVGYPHDLKGQGIYAYVTLNADQTPSEELRKELVAWVRKEIGPIASPDLIQWAPGLPKTRSGKIMRRILRKIAANEHDALGDTSTLADPGVVTDLVEHRMNRE
jgi:acetyl-CoA synthetase